MEHNISGLENVYNKEILGLYKKYSIKFKGERVLKTLILKNVKTGKHYKVEMYANVKVGDKIMRFKERDYLYNGEYEDCVVVKIIDKAKKVKGVVFSESASMPAAWRIPEYVNPMLKSFGKSPGCVMEFKSTRMGKNYIYGLYEEIKEEIKKEKEKERKEKEELSRLSKRPYFVTKVDIVKGEPEGKENLNKIKFPCYCSFNANNGISGDPSKSYKVHGIGRVDKTFTEGQIQYLLSWADHQQEDLSVICSTPSLKRLFEIYDIEVLKGELRLWKVVR